MLKKIRRILRKGRNVDQDYGTLEFTHEEWEDLRAVTPFTMTSPARIVTLSRCLEHIIRYNIPVDIV